MRDDSRSSGTAGQPDCPGRRARSEWNDGQKGLQEGECLEELVMFQKRYAVFTYIGINDGYSHH